MNTKKFLASLIIISLSTFSAAFLNTSTASPYRGALKKLAVTPSFQNYKPGEVLVKYKSSATLAERNLINKEAGVQKTLKKFKIKKQTIDLLKLKGNVSVGKAIDELEEQEEVEYAEPNYLYRTSYTPDDTNFAGNQWGLNNTGQTIQGIAGTADADIDAVEAWNVERGDSNPVTVAVIDSGIDTAHEDLSSKLWSNSDEINNSADDDGNGYVDDINGYNWAGISSYAYNVLWSFGSSNTYPRAQSIKGTGTSLTHIGLALAKVGSPGDLTVSVRSSLDGAILASFTINEGEVFTAPYYDEVYKALNTPVNLISGQTYYIQMQPASTDSSNYYYIASNDVNEEDYITDPYVDGQEHRYTGASWNSATYAENDFYFRANPNGYPKDNNGHGTHVSGIIGASMNNATGVTGTSSGVKIMALKAGDASGSLYTSDIISAIDYARINGADIINMSFGGSNFSASQQNAITNAYNAGVTLFAASGNEAQDGNPLEYPAGMSNVIGVGATTNKDERAAFSNYNAHVDISAPGQSIYSTMPSYEVGLNSYGYTQNYSYMSGTSMASPMAAGVAALLISQNPTYAPFQVQARMQYLADDLGSAGRDDQFGYGRINAYRALTGETTPPTNPAISSPTHPSSSSYYSNTNTSFSFSSSDSSEIQGYSYVLDQSPTTIPDTVSEGASATVNYSSLADGTWYLHVRAQDNLDNWGNTNHYQVNSDKTAPSITFTALNSNTYHKGIISLSASSSDNFSGLNSTSFYNGDTLLTSSGSTLASYSWNSSSSNGNITLKAQTTDKAGNINSSSQTIKVDNYKPRTSAPRKAKVKRGKKTKLYYKVTDPYTGGKAKVLIRIKKAVKKRVKKKIKTVWKTVKILNLGLVNIGKLNSKQLKVLLAKGKYKFFVYATDQAGNTQNNIASNSLIVI